MTLILFGGVIKTKVATWCVVLGPLRCASKEGWWSTAALGCVFFSASRILNYPPPMDVYLRKEMFDISTPTVDFSFLLQL